MGNGVQAYISYKVITKVILFVSFLSMYMHV